VQLPCPPVSYLEPRAGLLFLRCSFPRGGSRRFATQFKWWSFTEMPVSSNTSISERPLSLSGTIYRHTIWIDGVFRLMPISGSFIGTFGLAASQSMDVRELLGTCPYQSTLVPCSSMSLVTRLLQRAQLHAAWCPRNAPFPQSSRGILGCRLTTQLVPFAGPGGVRALTGCVVSDMRYTFNNLLL
jgi:hypothetical protein